MYNNPNFYNMQSFPTKPSFLSNFKKLNFNDILNGTQKTLNIINQAIPVIYQVKPLWENTKTIFKIAGAINTYDTKEETPKMKIKEIKNDNQESNKKRNKNIKKEVKKEKELNYNEPVFFL